MRRRGEEGREGSLEHNHTHIHTSTMWDSSQSQFGRAGTGRQRIRKDYLWRGRRRRRVRQGDEWRMKPVSQYHISGWRWDLVAITITCQAVMSLIAWPE